MAVLELEDLHAYYGKSHILQGINLSLESGRVIGILGRNGAGKTTLLRAIMGLAPRVHGCVKLFGTSIDAMPTDARARAGLTLMSQDMRVFPELSVEENCRTAAWTVDDAMPFDEVISIIPELKEHIRRPAGRLSGGQQQLVAIARSLTVRCKVLMLDEPTEGLMPSIVDRVGEIVKALADKSVAVLLVEQNVELTLSTCTHLYFLEKGKLVADGTPSSVVSKGMLERYLGINGGSIH